MRYNTWCALAQNKKCFLGTTSGVLNYEELRRTFGMPPFAIGKFWFDRIIQYASRSCFTEVSVERASEEEKKWGGKAMM